MKVDEIWTATGKNEGIFDIDRSLALQQATYAPLKNFNSERAESMPRHILYMRHLI